MQGLFWLVTLGFVLTIGGIAWYCLRKLRERRLAEEARAASFLAASSGRAKMVEAPATAPPAAGPATGDGVPQQKLLFEAAHKAGEAGEPALAIQLYARLLARYPATTFAAQVRTAVEAQKKKLSKV